MGGLKPTFAMATVRKTVQEFQENKSRKIVLILKKVGEDFVDRARSTNTYKDRTRNLRGSIGFAIYQDGRLIEGNFDGSTDGVSNAKKEADKVSKKFPNGYVLVGVAGMSYALYVEAKDFDVITGSAPTDLELKEYLDEIKQ